MKLDKICQYKIKSLYLYFLHSWFLHECLRTGWVAVITHHAFSLEAAGRVTLDLCLIPTFICIRSWQQNRGLWRSRSASSDTLLRHGEILDILKDEVCIDPPDCPSVPHIWTVRLRLSCCSACRRTLPSIPDCFCLQIWFRCYYWAFSIVLFCVRWISDGSYLHIFSLSLISTMRFKM